MSAAGTDGAVAVPWSAAEPSPPRWGKAIPSWFIAEKDSKYHYAIFKMWEAICTVTALILTTAKATTKKR